MAGSTFRGFYCVVLGKIKLRVCGKKTTSMLLSNLFQSDFNAAYIILYFTEDRKSVDIAAYFQVSVVLLTKHFILLHLLVLVLFL